MNDFEEQTENLDLLPADPPDYLTLPALNLLEEYGAGEAIPGSGSAAVFSALLAVELMRTVCKITTKKDDYEQDKAKCEYLLKELDEKYKPRLLALYREDVKAFDKVWRFRVQRNQAENDNEKRFWERVHLDALREATLIPIEAAEIALQLIPSAFYLFDRGYRAVRGDSGVAVSNLQSAISGALFVIFLNLRSFRAARWSEETKSKAIALAKDFTRVQAESMTRILSLQQDAPDFLDQQLQFDFISDLNTND